MSRCFTVAHERRGEDGQKRRLFRVVKVELRCTTFRQERGV